MSKIQEAPCPICGGESYAWGFLQDDDKVKFKRLNAPWLERATVFGGSPVRARLCERCGNIQMFSEDVSDE